MPPNGKSTVSFVLKRLLRGLLGGLLRGLLGGLLRGLLGGLLGGLLASEEKFVAV